MISPKLLNRYPPFAGINHHILEEIAMISNTIETAEDQWLFYEGDTADSLYIVIEGAIGLTTSIFLEDKSRDIEISTPIIERELLGWSALIKPHKYTSGGIAKRKSKLIEIEAVALRQLLDDNPEYGYQVMKGIGEVINERLENKNVEFTSLVLEAQNIPMESLYVTKDNG